MVHSTGTRGRIMDLTERMRRLLRKAMEESDVRGFFDQAVDVAVELAGAERGLLVRKEGERLIVVSARNVDRESLRGREARLSLSIAGATMDEATTHLIEDAARQGAFSTAESVYELGLRSVLSVPVMLEGTAVAALYVDSRFIAGAFGEEDARSLETVADFLSLCLWKHGMLEVQRRQRAEAADLREEIEALKAQLDELLAVTRSADRASAAPSRVVGAGRFPLLTGDSAAMLRMQAVMERVLDNDVTVLIIGESGTGKELVARSIFEHGRRRGGPFVAINCSSIPASLIESELFGHLKGSFTGATRDKKGLFEVAGGGTLLLDEVGEMPLEMQAKLLRALQHGEIQAVGDVTTRRVDVRVIAATNRNLEELVAAGKFREDLYYRLNIVTIEVPPLHKRKEDISVLVQHFLEENRRQGLTTVKGISPQAMLVLRRYSWPGNVRELETVLKSACLFAEGELLEASDFEALARAESVNPGERGGRSRRSSAT
ncbi:MAG: GAF domain-containing protein [Deltaproteobacteria bacterium]|nr:GAF domain-containing protein [Deltaproteobacteria bacterium]